MRTNTLAGQAHITTNIQIEAQVSVINTQHEALATQTRIPVEELPTAIRTAVGEPVMTINTHHKIYDFN
jgi:hypothetical protein